MFKLKTILIISLITVVGTGTVFYFTFFNINKENLDKTQTTPNVSFDPKPTPTKPAQTTDPDPASPEIGTNPQVTETQLPTTDSAKSSNLNTSVTNNESPLPTTANQNLNDGKLEFPILKISSPIIYSKLEDLFQKNTDGTINLKKPIQEDLKKGPTSTPVQKLLTKGVVHLAFTPLPGEVGNSYIVGHSSNYNSVKSDYNYVFEKLGDAKIGDEFIIYDQEGKAMTFKVFENIAINGTDTEIAYKDFKDRRVVTLQASILVNFVPLKRRLVRGELVNKT